MYTQKKEVFPQDYSCIIDPVMGKGGLYIGNLQAAQNINTLKKLQIKAVLTSCKGIQLNHPKTAVPYFLYVPAEDHESCDISKYFSQASSFINDCLQRTNIMVHCMAGVSRSVTLSISYLIKFKRMTFNQAFNLVKSRRKIICPNEGFIDLLKRFERDQPPVQDKDEIRYYSPTKTSAYLNNPSFSYSPKKDAQHQHNIDSIISKYQNYKINKAYDKNPQSQPYVYHQQNVETTAFSTLKPNKLKRFTSMNVQGNGYKQYSPNRPQNEPFSKLMSTNNLRPFNNIQNTVSKAQNIGFSDIDKRIQQIRQKYTFQSNPRTSNQKYDQRSSKYTVEESRYRGRASSGYSDYKKTRQPRDYSNYLQQREPVQFGDRRQVFSSTYGRQIFTTPGTNLRRLTSLQQY